MRVFCLGGAGSICREAALDIFEHSKPERLTIGDNNIERARSIASWLGGKNVDAVEVDVLNHKATAAVMAGYDVVMDGTTIKLNKDSTACIAMAGCHGLNLNGFGEENVFDKEFKDKGKLCVPGFGMTPGTTQMMAKYATDAMESVDTVRVSHGAFRPVAFSAAITETTCYEYDPALPGRVVFEDGEFKQVPPFARPREIELPAPYGKHVQYIIPHAETVTLASYLKNKGVRLIEVRGTWPPANMGLVRALYEFGFLRNPRVTVKGVGINVMDAIAEHLLTTPEGRTTALYGYSLHVEVEGVRDGKRVRHTIWHTHPASDGSVKGWEGLRAYTRNVGIPMAIGAAFIAEGKTKVTGVQIPERVFPPKEIFAALRLRGIEMHEKMEILGGK